MSPIAPPGVAQRRLPRKRLALAVLALGGLAALALGRMPAGGPAEPVYSVAQVVDGLTHRPSAWSGRIVLVRGWTTIVSLNRQGYTLDRAPRLVDVADPGKGITVEWDRLGPLPSAMLVLPVLDALVARRLNGVGVYRVRLAHRVLTAVPVVSPLPVTAPLTNPARHTAVQLPGGAGLAYDDAILVGDLN